MDPEITAEIDRLIRVQMAVLIRFSPAGHPFFAGPHHAYFMDRFNKLGGMTPDVSKHIGWEPSRYQETVSG